METLHVLLPPCASGNQSPVGSILKGPDAILDEFLVVNLLKKKV